MSSKDDEIQNKLKALEASPKEEESTQELTAPQKSSNVLHASNDENALADIDKFLSSDLNMLAGAGLILVGILMVFSHVRIGTSMLTWLGFGVHGMGFILLPLLVGIGMLIYNYRSRLAWIISIAGIALVIYTIFCQLIMTFQSVSLLGFLFMFLPLIAGIAFLAKGFQMRKRVKGEISDKSSL
jgi:hypothetical protein